MRCVLAQANEVISISDSEDSDSPPLLCSPHWVSRREQAQQAAPCVKRGRGRPRKMSVDFEGAQEGGAAPQTAAQPPVKRGRGRPRKDMGAAAGAGKASKQPQQQQAAKPPSQPPLQQQQGRRGGRGRGRLQLARPLSAPPSDEVEDTSLSKGGGVGGESSASLSVPSSSSSSSSSDGVEELSSDEVRGWKEQQRGERWGAREGCRRWWSGCAIPSVWSGCAIP